MTGRIVAWRGGRRDVILRITVARCRGVLLIVCCSVHPPAVQSGMLRFCRSGCPLGIAICWRMELNGRLLFGSRITNKARREIAQQHVPASRSETAKSLLSRWHPTCVRSTSDAQWSCVFQSKHSSVRMFEVVLRFGGVAYLIEEIPFKPWTRHFAALAVANAPSQRDSRVHPLGGRQLNPWNRQKRDTQLTTPRPAI